MRMGRVLALVGALLVLAIGGLGLAVYLTRDEDNVQVDNLLSQNFSKAVALAEDPDQGTNGVVDLRTLARFDWDRVLIVAKGTPRATISRRLGRPWTGVLGIDSGDSLIFLDGGDVARYADYRGSGRFTGLARPIAELPRDSAVFDVHALVISPRGG
jgi:hypothetical protein